MKVSHRLTRATGSSSLYQHIERIPFPVLKKQRRQGKTKTTNNKIIKWLNNKIKVPAQANGGPHHHFLHNLIINKFIKELIEIKKNTGCPKKNATPIFPYISVRFNGTGQCFIWAVRGCPTVRFAYRQWSEQQAVLEIFSFRFGLSYHTRNNFESIQSIYWRIYKDGEQR